MNTLGRMRAQRLRKPTASRSAADRIVPFTSETPLSSLAAVRSPLFLVFSRRLYARSSLRRIEPVCVAEQEGGLLFLGQSQRHRGQGIIVVPMRIVGRKQQPIEADPVDGVAQMDGWVRLFHRLRRHPDLVAQILARQTLEVRGFAAQRRTYLVEPPGERRHPGK